MFKNKKRIIELENELEACKIEKNCLVIKIDMLNAEMDNVIAECGNNIKLEK